jgi:MarR family transcriptional regulator, temperature-dependent positive regulator of motility
MFIMSSARFGGCDSGSALNHCQVKSQWRYPSRCSNQNDSAATFHSDRGAHDMQRSADGENPGGELGTRMLSGNAVTTAWRLNYIANFFAVPFYLALEQQIGISRPEYVILFCVAHHPGITAQEIVAVTGRPKNSISVAVSKLEGKRLIARRASKEDSRRMELRTTAAGHAVYRKIVPLLQERERRMLEPLSATERKRFDALLLKVARNVPAWASPDLAPLLK